MSKKKIYCMWGGEMVEKDEHEDCVCANCDHCGEPLDDKDEAVSLEAYNSTYLHKDCVMGYLEDNEEMKTRAQLQEENE